MQPNPTQALVQQLGLFIPLLIIFYFFIIRPQQKNQRDHKQMINNLQKNDEVVTSGGIHGTVVNIKDNTFVLRIDDNTKIEIQKNSISFVKKKREKAAQ